jgi:hypothetical protein
VKGTGAGQPDPRATEIRFAISVLLRCMATAAPPPRTTETAHPSQNPGARSARTFLQPQRRSPWQ